MTRCSACCSPKGCAVGRLAPKTKKIRIRTRTPMKSSLPASLGRNPEVPTMTGVPASPASSKGSAARSASGYVRLGRGGWNELFAERTAFERAFAELLLQAPQRQGRVLDIGCGDDFPEGLACLRGQLGP